MPKSKPPVSGSIRIAPVNIEQQPKQQIRRSAIETGEQFEGLPDSEGTLL